MFFQEPQVDFIVIGQHDIYTESVQMGWNACQQAGPNGDMQEKSMCEFLHYVTVGKEEYCQKNTERENAPWENVTNKLTGTDQEASDAVKQAIAPASTAAPVRSAPHFNNNLFN